MNTIRCRGSGDDQRGRRRPRSITGRPGRAAVIVTSLLLLALAVPLWAQTPPGTWITNTAEVATYYPSVSAYGVTYSNAADTQVVDTGVTIQLARVTPAAVTNGNAVVLFTVSAVSFSPIDTVYVDLSPLESASLVLLKNDGTSGDTAAADNLWNVRVTIDSRVIGDTFILTLRVIAQNGDSKTATVTLVVTDTTASFVTLNSLGAWWTIGRNVRVSGNALSLGVGFNDTMASVLFEYRRNGTAAWVACDTGTWSDRNPDPTGYYWGIYWNMDGLADDTYDVRATGTKASGERDPSPAILRVVKDSTDSWINEYNLVADNRHVRRQKYSRDLPDTAIIVEGTALYLSAAAMASFDTCWLRLTVLRTPSAEAPAPEAGSNFIVPGDGAYRRFEREDGARFFDDYVTLVIPYSDSGLACAEADLAIYRYDPALGTWIREEGCEVDAVRNIVSVRVRHFTDFAVFGVAPAPNLGNVLIYPNPFIPYDGDPQTGSPFVRGDNTTGIIFRNVTATVDIDIFSVSGRRVSTIHATNTGGNVQWDAKSDDGHEVASGMYLAVIRAPSGEKVTKKFMVIR